MFRTWQRAKSFHCPPYWNWRGVSIKGSIWTLVRIQSATRGVGFLCGDHTVEQGWGDLSIWPKGTPDVSGWAQRHFRNGRTGLPPVAPQNSLSDDQSSNHREQIFSGSQKFDTWKEDWQIPPSHWTGPYQDGKRGPTTVPLWKQHVGMLIFLLCPGTLRRDRWADFPVKCQLPAGGDKLAVGRPNGFLSKIS